MMQKITKMQQLAVLLLILLLSTEADAAQRWFHIEIIVFAQFDETNEQFTQSQSQINWPGRSARVSGTQYSLAQLKQAPKAFASVQPADRMLNNSYGSIRRGAGYRPLVHLSWVQPVGSNRVGEAVRVKAGGLDGLIKIQRGNYLHLLADFEYTKDETVYRLNEKRRIKLNETHYLDHPRLGIIARVSPL